MQRVCSVGVFNVKEVGTSKVMTPEQIQGILQISILPAHGIALVLWCLYLNKKESNDKTRETDNP